MIVHGLHGADRGRSSVGKGSLPRFATRCQDRISQLAQPITIVVKGVVAAGARLACAFLRVLSTLAIL